MLNHAQDFNFLQNQGCKRLNRVNQAHKNGLFIYWFISLFIY